MGSLHIKRQVNLWKQERKNGEIVLCGICGDPITKGNSKNRGGMTADHIIPLSVGGPDTITNIQPAHSKCNAMKSSSLNYTPEEIIKKVDELNKKLKKKREIALRKEIIMTQHFGEDHLNWKQRIALILTITAYVSVPILVFSGVLK